VRWDGSEWNALNPDPRVCNRAACWEQVLRGAGAWAAVLISAWGVSVVARNGALTEMELRVWTQVKISLACRNYRFQMGVEFYVYCSGTESFGGSATYGNKMGIALVSFK
jgi:hypothetical protein